MVHQDSWILKITQPSADAPASTGPTVRWERRKKPANQPNPPRAGATMAYHKGRGIMFGGVHDVENSEEGIESEFYDTLQAWNTDRNRFFQLSLRRPRAPGKKQHTQNQALKGRGRSKADEEELLRNLAALEAKGSVSNTEPKEMDIETPNITEESNVAAVTTAPIRFEMPHKRFNSQLAIQDDTLFIFGGTFEKGDQEFTFNDLYSIDLSKLDGVKEIFYNEPQNWNDNVEDNSDEEDEEDEEEDDEEDERDDDVFSQGGDSIAPTDITEPQVISDLAITDAETEQETEAAARDSRPHPRPFENLREFFNRTSNDWQNLLIDGLKERGLGAEKTVKELRKEAFDIAEEKWWDCREEIMALEDEQEEAGIGEVVSIADRGDATASSGGRRR